MCGDSETTSRTSNTIDPKLKEMATSAYGKVETLADKPFEPYGGNRVAGFNPDQQSSFDMIRQMAGGFDPSVAGTAGQYAQQYATAPGQEIQTSRLVDEGGRLGKISDYMNPYLENSLNPAIRKIQESGSQQRNEIGAGATMSGAFGDARHGVVEGNQYQGENEAIGDLTSRMMSEGFGQAMGQRGADEARFMGADTFNAESNERMLERLFSGAQGMLGAQSGGIQNWLQAINPQLAAGTQQQQQDQSGLNVGFEDYLMGYDHPYKNMEILLAALNGQPYDSSQTRTNTEPNNWLGSLGGGLLGAFL